MRSGARGGNLSSVLESEVGEERFFEELLGELVKVEGPYLLSGLIGKNIPHSFCIGIPLIGIEESL